jgi:sialidase-1
MKVGKSAAFVAISGDGGHSWVKTREVARDPQVNFYEPCLARLAGGRLIAHLRASSNGGYLWQVTSDDGGLTWCKPWQTPMWGFPAHVVQVADGRVLSVYGYRREPFGIRACLSNDGGDTWDMEHELIIRADLPTRVIGYPTAIALADGTVFTVYWTEDAAGVTAIEGTYVRL